jgi:anaerobic magnesium-protoporphyrin IX monomethyl ester cyclase
MATHAARILIIGPRTCSEGHEYYRYIMPMGLAYISSVLKQDGYMVDILNLNHGDEPVDIVIRKAVSDCKYTYVLTGGLSVHYSAVRQCVESVRVHAPSAKIILGGNLISSRPEPMWNALRPDYMVLGEGEATIVELLGHLESNRDLSKVKGIGYRRDGGDLALTAPRRAIQDIGTLPLPDYEGLGYGEYLDNIKSSTLYYYDVFDNPRPYPLLSSRSCPYQCTFCYRPKQNTYRQRAIASVMEEIAFALERYRANLFDIYDELLANNRKRVLEFCAEMKRLTRSVPWEVKWSCQMRVDRLDRELLATMKDAGCYILSLGLESYSPLVLKSMKKRITPEQIDRALQICHDLNMTVQGNFILGDVAETKETAKETINYWKKTRRLYGTAISLGFIEVYPGTELYTHAVETGVITDEIEFIANRLTDPINITNAMAASDFDALRREVDKATFKHATYVTPAVIEKIGGGYTIHVKCPFCRAVSVYGNYIPPGRDSYSVQEMCCRKCRMRFRIASREFKVRIALRKVLGERVWDLLRAGWKSLRGSEKGRRSDPANCPTEFGGAISD